VGLFSHRSSRHTSTRKAKRLERQRAESAPAYLDWIEQYTFEPDAVSPPGNATWTSRSIRRAHDHAQAGRRRVS